MHHYILCFELFLNVCHDTPLNITFHRFSAYGMPFPVDNTIQKFRKNPFMNRQRIPHGVVHPDSRILLFLIRHDK